MLKHKKDEKKKAEGQYISYINEKDERVVERGEPLPPAPTEPKRPPVPQEPPKVEFKKFDTVVVKSFEQVGQALNDYERIHCCIIDKWDVEQGASGRIYVTVEVQKRG